MGEASDLIDAMRERCRQKGFVGMKGLGVLFRHLDKDFSKVVCLQEFCEGLTNCGIGMTQEEYKIVFKHFDKDNSGQVDFRELLIALRPDKMPKKRLALVVQAFEKLDVIKDGEIKLEDLRLIYKENAKRHPEYQAGKWTVDEVLQSFLDTFDDPENKDGMVSLQDFIKYYENVSCTIDDDSYFELMMRTSWALNKADNNAESSQHKQSRSSWNRGGRF